MSSHRLNAHGLSADDKTGMTLRTRSNQVDSRWRVRREFEYVGGGTTTMMARRFVPRAKNRRASTT
jgi:hypothetical protein